MASATGARPEIKLKVNGREYAGWKTARVTRSIESVAGSFELGISERWSQDADPWPILEEDECSLSIGSEVLITGYVDERSPSFDATQHGLSITGRDKTGRPGRLQRGPDEVGIPERRGSGVLQESRGPVWDRRDVAVGDHPEHVA
jgi:hypothetical protein